MKKKTSSQTSTTQVAKHEENNNQFVAEVVAEDFMKFIKKKDRNNLSGTDKYYLKKLIAEAVRFSDVRLVRTIKNYMNAEVKD